MCSLWFLAVFLVGICSADVSAANISTLPEVAANASGIAEAADIVSLPTANTSIQADGSKPAADVPGEDLRQSANRTEQAEVDFIANASSQAVAVEAAEELQPTVDPAGIVDANASSQEEVEEEVQPTGDNLLPPLANATAGFIVSQPGNSSGKGPSPAVDELGNSTTVAPGGLEAAESTTPTADLSTQTDAAVVEPAAESQEEASVEAANGTEGSAVPSATSDVAESSASEGSSAVSTSSSPSMSEAATLPPLAELQELAELQDGKEKVGQVTTGAILRYALPFIGDIAKDASVSLRVEAFAGSVAVCILPPGLAEGDSARASDSWPSGCSNFNAVADALDFASGGLAAFDFEAEQLLPSANGHALLLIKGLSGPSNDFAIRAAVAGAAVKVGEEHRVLVDSMRPACCGRASTPKQKPFQRRYLHFVQLSDAVVQDAASAAAEIELRPLAAGSLEGAVLRARRRGGEEMWPSEAAASTDALASGGRLTLVAKLWQVLGSGAEASVSERGTMSAASEAMHSGFWLEVMVEAPQALNFTLRVGKFHPGREASPSSWLSPGVPLMGAAETGRIAKYQFDLPDSKADAWQVRVRRCYGRMRLKLHCSGTSEECTRSIDMGADVLLPLPKPSPKRAAEPGRATVLLEPLPIGGDDSAQADDTTSNCSFEITLLPGPAHNFSRLGEPFLQLQQAALQPKAAPGRLAVRFAAATHLNGTHTKPSVTTRYTLVAIGQNDPLLSAQSTCGIRAALAHGAAVAGQPVENAFGAPEGALVEAMVPHLGHLSNKDIRVNVLAEAIDANGSSLDVVTYAAFELNATAVAALAEPDLSSGALGLFCVALGAGAFVMVSRRREGQLEDIHDPEAECIRDDVEMQGVSDSNYDLHTERSKSRISFAPRSRGGYVPPSV